MTTATVQVRDSRLRAYGQFLFALFYYFLARALAHHGALGLVGERWQPLTEQAMLVFLLLLGFAGLGFSLNRQVQPISAQGLPRRAGFMQEFGMGLAAGWGVAAVCVAAMALFGGIAVSISPSLSSWGWLLVDFAYFALLCLGEELTFRGYAFQRFARATGQAGAVFGFSLLYAFLESMTPGASRTTAVTSFVLAVGLSLAYLRTQALWVSWGLNFGWKASRALLFGLAVNGDNSHSAVVQGDPTGSFWLTGGGFGLESSWLAFIVMLALVPVIYRMTRELDYRYNVPELIPGGIPVDIDAAARRQHEDAMGASEPAPPPLVQIAPLSAPLVAPMIPQAPAANPEPDEPNTGNESTR
ncbi:CPBP family intramembrane glutamic endopeptidase [Occallatibacter riparius]|uniref:CPBP family intramembrane metalloprotease n=1 Tax=Occallatibacter riparius TaxID=1002689 RepID=A0A9J7BJ80_9BACT|nr:CPBP family intramembrane glutamic endopeptidase [Occallatibacter riparius]UWZ82579.1 CPBP family intramembrane metalloprotease [Occallatibacter riparius]